MALRSKDHLFLEHLYGAMLGLGLEAELLAHGSQALEAFLTKAAALAAPAEAPVSAEQARQLSLLVELYKKRGQHAKVRNKSAFATTRF